MVCNTVFFQDSVEREYDFQNLERKREREREKERERKKNLPAQSHIVC